MWLLGVVQAADVGDGGVGDVGDGNGHVHACAAACMQPACSNAEFYIYIYIPLGSFTLLPS